MEGKMNAYRILVGKAEGRGALGRPKCKWVDNIKMDLREIELGMEWIDLAHGRNQWGARMYMVVKLWVP
jgi:hypothetical protein